MISSCDVTLSSRGDIPKLASKVEFGAGGAFDMW
jgi:hypothetical protein